jgi:O-antigen ligase
MTCLQPKIARAAFYLACASAVSILYSIAACNILMVLALVALLISGEKLRFPPVKLPLALYFAGTVISLAASQDPAAGRPQIRKFFVFLMLLVVSSAVAKAREARVVAWCWAGSATLAAALGFVQFARKWEAAQELGRNFYTYYVGERITGFMSHWMTYGGQLMIVLMLLGAFLIFSDQARRWLWVWIAAAVVIGAAILLGWTRGIWIGTGAGVVYLLWNWKKWLVAVVPAAVALLLVVPGPMHERLTSFLKPHGEVDSNQHRKVTWRTGLRMIAAHPLLGLGPEGVKLHFKEYVPEDVKQLPEGWYGHLHNIYLHYAAERGIPTMLALMWMLARILLDFWRGARRAPPGSDAGFFLHGAVAALIAILVEGIFEHNLGDSEVLMLFLAMVSMGYACRDEVEHAG